MYNVNMKDIKDSLLEKEVCTTNTHSPPIFLYNTPSKNSVIIVSLPAFL